MKTFNPDAIVAYKKEIGMTAKLCDKTVMEALEAMNTRSENDNAKKSTACKFGVDLKACETVARHLMQYAGITSVDDFHARSAGKADGRVGRNLPFEVKGGGHFGHFPENWEADDIYPHAKLIVFCLAEDIAAQDDTFRGLLEYSAVMSRALFFDLLENASRKGIHGTLHLTGKGNKVLAFQPTPLEKVRQAVRDLLDAGEIDTLGYYLESR